MDEHGTRIDVFADDGKRLGFHWELGRDRQPPSQPDAIVDGTPLSRRAAIGALAATVVGATVATVNEMSSGSPNATRASGGIVRRPPPTTAPEPPATTVAGPSTTMSAPSTTSTTTTVPATTIPTTTTTTTTTPPPAPEPPVVTTPTEPPPPAPATEIAPVPPAALTGPRLVLRAEWEEAPRTFDRLGSGIGTVIVHHTEPADPVRALTVDPATGLRELERFAVAPPREWAGISYHWIVFNDGTIGEGRGWAHQGAHAKGDLPNTVGSDYNATSYGIAVHGNYEAAMPSQAALDSVAWTICAGIANGFIAPSPDILGHRDVTNTACPGDAFYLGLDYIRVKVREFSLPTPERGFGL